MTNETYTLDLETGSAAETEALGIRLACVLNGGMVITLSGELGAGKTVFVRGIACGLNVPPGVVVTSPTYVLQHVYRGGRLTLYHIDAYRLVGGAGELESSGLTECFNDDNGLVCVEWPERIGDHRWPEDRIDVNIEHYEPQKRRIRIIASGPRALVALKQLT
ncbi:MAG TPA: tRNA (adenosine(37)-N6)-threonylcarbamoyltransferase complex ATPase subunit type 1 TsaE [Planctomycetota bacterium]|nr:tRNA (adenosine(37)-N6)-threonylcarbamoyltransferase complex ATPase subunit type 1 TsaE [Planctomycetota bacterium]